MSATGKGLTAVIDAFQAFWRAVEGDDLDAERTAMRSLRDATTSCGQRNTKRMSPHAAALTFLVRAESIHMTRAINRIGERLAALEAGRND